MAALRLDQTGPDQTRAGAARTVAPHPEQGWSLLCNGMIVFDDMGASLYLTAARGSAPAPAPG
jgi:hypothetical protein